MYGMVTNPRCLKDLDCIAACPEQAVQYGFRKPPIFRKGHPMRSYSGRFGFSLKEDLFMLAVFVFTIFIYRGLYDAVPFLLAVGFAVCTAYLALLSWRFLQRKSMQLRGIMLKDTGHVRKGGKVFGVAMVTLLLLVLHSALVQWHTWRGKALFMEVAANSGVNASSDHVQESIAHYRTALSIGFIAPIDRRKELANLYIIAGGRPSAVTLLEGIVAQDPAHVEARYRLGELANDAGDRNAALDHWEKTLAVGVVRPHSRDSELLGMAALAVADGYAGVGDHMRAEQLYEEASTRLMNDPRPLLAWSGMLARTGDEKRAIELLERTLSLGADEVLVRNNLGGLMLREGRWEDAKGQYQRLAELRPADAQMRYTLGVAQARTGDPKAARESLSHALRLDPKHAGAKQALELLVIQRTNTGS